MQLSDLDELPVSYIPNSGRLSHDPAEPRQVQYFVVRVVDEDDPCLEDIYGPTTELSDVMDFSPNYPDVAGICRLNADWSSEILFWWNGWQWVRKS